MILISVFFSRVYAFHDDVHVCWLQRPVEKICIPENQNRRQRTTSWLRFLRVMSLPQTKKNNLWHVTLTCLIKNFSLDFLVCSCIVGVLIGKCVRCHSPSTRSTPPPTPSSRLLWEFMQSLSSTCFGDVLIGQCATHYQPTYSFVEIIVDSTFWPKVHSVLYKSSLGSCFCIIVVFYVHFIKDGLLFRCEHHIAFKEAFTQIFFSFKARRNMLVSLRMR